MSSRYADLFGGLPAIAGNVVAGLYAMMLPGVRTAAWLLAAFSAPGCKYVVMYLGEDGEIHIVHTVERLQASFAFPNSRHLDQCIGILDETNDFGGNLVAITDDFFRPVDVADVASLAAIAAAGNADATNAGQLLVPADGAATAVQTRFGILVPPRYVGNILRALELGPVTPRDMLVLVDNLQGDAAAAADHVQFTNWVRVAFSRGIGAANPLLHDASRPVPVMVDGALGSSRATIRDRDFPPPVLAGTGAAAMQPIVTAMADMTTALQTAADAREAARAATKATEAAERTSPARTWPAGLERMLRMCHVTDQLNLPRTWLEIARQGIKKALSVLRAAALSPPQDPTTALQQRSTLTVHPAIGPKMTGPTFMDGVDDFECLLSPFVVSFPNSAAMAAANSQSELYEEQANDVVSASFTERLDSKKAIQLCLPATFLQLRLVLGAYYRWLQILLGEAHLVPAGFREVVDTLDKMQASSGLEGKFSSAKACAGFLQVVQNYMWEWADRQAYSDTPTPSEFALLARDLRLSNTDFEKVTLSPLLTKKASPAAPRTSPQTSSQTPTTVRLAHRVHGVFDESILVAKLLEAEVPPRIGNRPPCLNFHVRGQCTTGCKYAYDHRDHTIEESAVLIKYMAVNGPKVKAAAERA
jgi:hypothetical protein